MDQQRQEAFQKLRPVCVELSSVSLKFKAKQSTSKDVLHALNEQQSVLADLSHHNLLDAKLAEYAFYPLTHVLNESRNVSPRCVEVAVRSTELIIAHGWRSKLSLEMGKQLLILMSLLVGGDAKKESASPSDELKVAAFNCIAAVIKWLSAGSSTKSVFSDVNARNIVDQLTYMLDESISGSISDEVQMAAGNALSELFSAISDRVLLASLLPRTVSSLVQALRPSTQARRTHKVLSNNIALLRLILLKTLAGDVLAEANVDESATATALDDAWLNATSAQVRNALIQVTKLRDHDRADVRQALVDLCIMVIEECGKSLSDSVPVMLETLVILSEGDSGFNSSRAVRRMISTNPQLFDILRTCFFGWTQALPRLMQASDDQPKELMIKKITAGFDLIGDSVEIDDTMINTVTTTLMSSISNATQQDTLKPSAILPLSGNPDNLEIPLETSPQVYQQVLFNHQSQQLSAEQLEKWIQKVKQHSSFGAICRKVVDAVPNNEIPQKVAALWLAVQMLRKDKSSSLDLEDLIIMDSPRDRSSSRSYLIYDLYSSTKELLLDSSPFPDQEQDWRLTALSMETLTLQAQNLGKEYRTELYETLYPVLALFSSRNELLRSHAVATLNMVASACEYSSAQEMLIENVDYLVNSIAWKLNSFDLSPEAPRVLNMVVRLVGARLIPHLDDLISSIFAALDNYHGYPTWVEMLFTVLKTIVDESAKQPVLAISHDQKHGTFQRRIGYQASTTGSLLEDLQARKKRKLMHHRDNPGDEQNLSAPHRPWSQERDNPDYQAPIPESEQNGISLDSLLKEDEEHPLPGPTSEKDEDPMTPQSKSHDLLLKIAQATIPHLSSPSPRVRHLLLQLLQQISPLLARHENTFLPLINVTWSAIVPRLFADQVNTSLDFSDQVQEYTNAEYPYNIAAAAGLITILCENAQGFMSSRIEQIFKPLIKLFKQTHSNIQSNKKSITASTIKTIDTTARDPQLSLRPVPDDTNSGFQITQPSPLVSKQITTTTNHPGVERHNPNQDQSMSKGMSTNRSQAQILSSLITLLCTILSHVPLQADHTDEIIQVLSPFIADTDRVIAAIELFNPDILWLLRERDQIEREIEARHRGLWDRSWNSNDAKVDERLMEIVF